MLLQIWPFQIFVPMARWLKLQSQCFSKLRNNLGLRASTKTTNCIYSSNAICSRQHVLSPHCSVQRTLILFKHFFWRFLLSKKEFHDGRYQDRQVMLLWASLDVEKRESKAVNYHNNIASWEIQNKSRRHYARWLRIVTSSLMLSWRHIPPMWSYFYFNPLTHFRLKIIAYVKFPHQKIL